MKFIWIIVLILLLILFILFFKKNKKIETNKFIVIKPTGGLCNKLRVLFSCYKMATQHNKKLIVIWNIDESCPGLFLDYFKPLPNVIFQKTNKNNLYINYNGCSGCRNYSPDYNKLELTSYMKKIIDERKRILQNNYIAVHIRRTDHIELAKRNNSFTDDNQFIEFIDNNISNKKLYISTDNPTTYNKFKQKYKQQVKFDFHNNNDNNVRKTSLKDAIIDIYMCKYANKFKGSGYSSFSDLIKILRNE